MSEPSSSGSGSSDSWSGSSSDSGWSSYDAGSSAGTPSAASEVPPLFTQQSASDGYPAYGAPYIQPSYAQPTYGAPGYGQAPYGGMPYGAMPYGSPYGRPPENNLVWAIVSIVFSIVMCSWFATPIGIVAAVKSAKVDALWAQGQFPAALEAAKSARTLSIWCLVVSGLLALLWIFLVFVAPFVFVAAMA